MMQILKRARGCIVAVGVLAAAFERPALAYDSDGASETRAHAPGKPLGYPILLQRYFEDPRRGPSLNGEYRWDAAIIHKNHGALKDPALAPLAGPFDLLKQSGGGANANGVYADGSPLLETIFQCKEIYPNAGVPDMKKCSAIPSSDHDLAPGTDERFKPGWVRVRLAWNHGRAEHMLIVIEAAKLAGLAGPDNDLFKRPFFVRYPTLNQLVADRLPTDPDNTMLVSQTYVPSDPATVGSHAVRSVFLPELAQMPDVSNSVADWVDGNEKCRIPGLADAFTQPTAACHEFTSVMGMLNSTHFLPSSHAMWKHYHQMAIAKMSQCKPLANLIPNYYNDFLKDGYWKRNWSEPYTSFADTEAHECEREAMVFEMFAQHFLQDAWSTGHMWARWGHPSLEDFPFALPGEDPATVDPVEVPMRKAFIASLTAIMSGIVHGDKSVAEGVAIRRAEEFLQNVVKKELEDRGQGQFVPYIDTIDVPKLVRQAPIMNDPLNGPFIIDPNLIQFNTYQISIPLPFGGAAHIPIPIPRLTNKDWVTWSLAGVKSPGIGDLFLSPSFDPDATPFGGSVFIHSDSSLSDPYSSQRRRLLACSAVSLIEVYASGPMVHGPMVSSPQTQGAGIDVADADSSKCWDQRVTNRSLWGGTSPLPLAYVQSADGATPAQVARDVLGKINKTTAEAAVGKNIAHVKTVDSMSKFKQDLIGAFTDEFERIALLYEIDQRANPDGTNLAKGVDSSGEPITFLGVPPNHLRVSSLDEFPVDDSSTQFPGITLPGSPRAVSYLDSAQNPDVDTDRMFWRANLKEACEPTAAKIAELRRRCTLASRGGGIGDPEACTECVDLAEVNTPIAVPSSSEAILGSKCTSLGFYDLLHVPAGLEPAWFDVTERFKTEYGQGLDKYPVNVPAYFNALHFCTGTFPFFSGFLLEWDTRPLWDPEKIAGILRGEMLLSSGERTRCVCNSDFGIGGWERLGQFGSMTRRIATGVGQLGPEFPFHGLRPVVAAYEEDQITTNPYNSCREYCDSFWVPGSFHAGHFDAYPSFNYVKGYTTSLDTLVEQVGGHPVIDNPKFSLPAYERSDLASDSPFPRPDILKVPFCGVTQRVVIDTNSCQAQAPDASGAALEPVVQTEYDSPWHEWGGGITAVSRSGCIRYEPVKFSLECPLGSVCDAGGVCVRQICTGTADNADGSVSGNCCTNNDSDVKDGEGNGVITNGRCGGGAGGQPGNGGSDGASGGSGGVNAGGTASGGTAAGGAAGSMGGGSVVVTTPGGTVDGAIGSGSVVCPAVSNGTCAPGTACCQTTSNSSCVTSFAACSCNGAVSCPALGCDGPEDCPGKQCCASFDTAGVDQSLAKTWCRDTCLPVEAQVCHTLSECPGPNPRCDSVEDGVNVCF